MTREEAISRIQQALGVPNRFQGLVLIDEELANMAIEALQAEPVKHGKWKYYNYSDISNPYCGYNECSVCKHHEHIEHKFCPNCGAKMDKEEEE